MNSAQEFIGPLVDLIGRARQMPLGQAQIPGQRPSASNAPKVMLFSPHPDDEVVVGALALRLQREANWEVVNVAVTQGSNPARQGARWEELERCCRYLSFRLIQTRPGGLERINPQARSKHPVEWQAAVDRVAEILRAERPAAICFPHDEDWNSTHIGTHHLIMDALRQLGPEFKCFTVETEFWGAMDQPNLMVESTPEQVAELITGLTFHVGEVQRNPYHVRLPAWMMDNVRRGCELVGGQGGAAPDYLFATLYRTRRWEFGQYHDVWKGGRFLGREQSPGELFP